jgi:hypothetical protein
MRQSPALIIASRMKFLPVFIALIDIMSERNKVVRSRTLKHSLGSAVRGR